MDRRDEAGEIRRMQRINRIAVFTLGCMGVIAVIAIGFGVHALMVRQAHHVGDSPPAPRFGGR